MVLRVLGIVWCFKIDKCYCNADGEYDEENPEIEDADLCTIGEMAASAFGWL